MLTENKVLILGFHRFYGTCAKFSVTQWDLETYEVFTVAKYVQFNRAEMYAFRESYLLCVSLVN